MVAFTPGHSTVSVLRPDVWTSRRVIPAGIIIGLPDAIKSSQCMPDAGFACVELIGAAWESSDRQQNRVLTPSEAVAGTESLEMNDCLGPGLFAGARGDMTRETR